MRLLALFMLVMLTSARAAPPPGTDLDSDEHRWFEQQYSMHRDWCCNISDGHVISDQDWRAGDRGYEVRIDGNWYSIPAEALRDPRGGPNPTGHAIVWYVAGEGRKPTIYCFAPGTMY